MIFFRIHGLRFTIDHAGIAFQFFFDFFHKIWIQQIIVAADMNIFFCHK